MSKPLVLIVSGALLGAMIGLVHVGGEFSFRGVGTVLEGLAGVLRGLKTEVIGATASAPRAAPQGKMFTACLTRSGPHFERSLKNLLAFHEHEATLDLVECLLGGDPMTFCDTDGAQQAADAMEIYLWSRDDARHTSPAHDLADKIHMLDRSGPEQKVDDDPFVVTWAGPRDRALFERVKDLVKQGYLDPGPLTFSGRTELREAVRGVQAAAPRCVRTASP
jgi:hypothetical protein